MTGVGPTVTSPGTEPRKSGPAVTDDVRLSNLVVVFLPVALAAFFWLDGFLDPMFSPAVRLAGLPLGWWLMACVVLLWASGGLLIWRARSPTRTLPWMLVFIFPALILLILSPAIVLILQREQGWVTYAAPDGSFTVVFPGGPYEETTEVDTPGALPYTDHEVGWVSSDRSTGYWVNYKDYPQGSMSGVDLKTRYDSLQADAIAAVGATLVMAKDISLGGHPGREFTAAYGDGTLTARMYLVGDRLYTQDTNSSQPNASDVAAFFDSLRIVGE